MEFELRIPELPIRLGLDRPMTEDELLAFCARNDVLRVEREPNGELSIMSPSGLQASEGESELIYQLATWAKQDGRGRAFSSNAGFTLPDGSVRAPDVSWIAHSRMNMLTKEERRGFAPICPEFIVELLSPSDKLPALQAKMREWIANGAQLAWLIDPERKTVEIYRPGKDTPDVLEGVTSVEGEGPVFGFILELTPVWNPA